VILKPMAATTLTSNQASGVLTVDLAAIQANWKLLASLSNPAETGAVVKSNAYGLGITQVAQSLWEIGARRFYVAQIDEGLELRQILPNAEIVVLSPTLPEGLKAATAAELVVTLNNEEALGYWKEAINPPKANLHFDTGITRLGFDDTSIDGMWRDLSSEEQSKVEEFSSHLACADEPSHHMNKIQLDRFEKATSGIPSAMRRSLANSSGIFMGGSFLQNSVRPGMALYGLNPTPDRLNPMQRVVTLNVRILQIQRLTRQESVGYGATAIAKAGSVIATLGAGYADGLTRSLSGVGNVFICNEPAPIIGRVSMDLIAVDVSHIPERLLDKTTYAEIIGEKQSADELATSAGTIGYEILTSIGRRYARNYEGAI
jgi:alanine racemase